MGDTIKKVKYYEEIQEMTLFDDSFMTLAFDGNIEAMQLILRIIMGRDDITVSRVKTQSKQPVFTGHSVIFDIDVLDASGAQIDVEFQKSNGGAVPERARYFKETDKGGSEMDDVMERLINREKEIERKEVRKEIIKKLIMKGNDSFEEIAECVGVSEDTVRQIADEMSVLA